MKKRGFTLIELLVVIAILAILITLGSKGLRNARISAKKAQAMVEMKSIETAIKAYISKYGKLPVIDALQGNPEPTFDAVFSQETIRILIGEDLTWNPAGMVFIEQQGSATNGVFLDPWGEQYLIALDTDYDGQVDFGQNTIRRKIALRADGLYKLGGEEDTNHQIKSWE
ncbi:MAG: type II secretion system protein [Pontiella sp.]